MNLQTARPELTGSPEASPSVTLRGHWLIITRVTWIAVALLAVTLFVAGLPVLYDEFRTLSYFDIGDRDAGGATLAGLGITVNFYAGYLLVLGIVFAVVCFAVAAVIFWRKSDEPMALFVALLLVLLGAIFWGTTHALGTLHPILEWLSSVLASLSLGSLFLFFYLFPNGRFVPRWTYWLAVVLIVVMIPIALFPGPPFDIENWPPLPFALFVLGWLLPGIFAQVYRYRYVSGPTQRQQTKWVVFGFTTALMGWVGVVSLLATLPSLQPGSLAADLVGATSTMAFMLLIPLSLGIAILRYRLWDIDIIINRTLVYGALTVSVVGIYVLVVGSLGALLWTQSNFLVSVLAIGIVALLFQPLRNSLQRGINHLMYGERDEPYAVLSRLGQRLEATMASDAVLMTIVETVAQALKLPYAAIALERDGGFEIAAAHGSPTDDSTVLPLVYQRETVGQLILAPRAPGETFTPADRRLLEGVARHAEVAVHAVRLTADLQRSRERLVMAREEERRRLRRDLHDGLGPTLAGLTFSLGAARNLLTHEPEDADALLARLKDQTQGAVSDVRRLVYGLRPPALDDLGLVPAIREQAAGHGLLADDHFDGTRREAGQENGLVFSVEAPEHLPPLPAAVEVACYRIAQEAMTNVARHAQARACHVRLSLDDAENALELEVVDDGVGISENRRAGVGMTSMRERVAELGGTCTVTSAPAGGTRMLARLPLPAREE